MHEWNSLIKTGERLMKPLFSDLNLANYYKMSGSRMNATDSWRVLWTLGQSFRDSWSDPSSKGSRECLYSQVVSKKCKGSCSWVNIVTSTHSIPHEQHCSHKCVNLRVSSAISNYKLEVNLHSFVLLAVVNVWSYVFSKVLIFKPGTRWPQAGASLVS